MQLKPVEHQVVVLMGASSGIGRATAHHFAARGARVVVSARNEDGLASLVDEIHQQGGEASYIVADVRNFRQVQQVAAFAYNAYGRLDTWVHLAAVAVYATVEQTTPEEFQQVIDVNLVGQFHGVKAALPYLRREGRGALIHVSSIEGIRTMPYHGAYGAAKHGINGMTDALRVELAHEGLPISVTNIMPATINTPFFTKARSKIGVLPKGLPPIYSPRLVAEAIVYAAEHPIRDLFVGDSARMMAAMQWASPKLMDKFMLATGFGGQHTHRPKPHYAPDALFAPMPDQQSVEGEFRSMPISVGDQLITSPTFRTVAAGLLLGAVATTAYRAWQRGDGYH